jgi:hypothetical protein
MRDNRNSEFSICNPFLRKIGEDLTIFNRKLYSKESGFYGKNFKKDGLFALIDLLQKDQFSYEVITAISINCFLRTRQAANTSAK